MTTTAIAWLRRDLRLTHNPALAGTLKVCERIVPLYIHDLAESRHEALQAWERIK